MEELKTQAQFEHEIWQTNKPDLFIVYFTAPWCSACRRLDMNSIVIGRPNVRFYKCDSDVNQYTASFCGVRSLPTFVAFRNRKVVDQISNSSTSAIKEWLADLCVQNNL